MTAMATKGEEEVVALERIEGVAALSGWSGVAFLLLQMGWLPAAWED